MTTDAIQDKLRKLLIISHDHVRIDKFDIRRNNVVQRTPNSMMTSPIGECVVIVLAILHVFCVISVMI